ncbi:MAG TPA: hypothetical protein VM577_08470 [Anaerovoracaceae bacterium]|nr:hypothetical protein [Anaerovoracaceae bacterium]
MTDTFQLPDIPDLSGISEPTSQPFENGWYEGTILEKREFIDNNGNERVFESSDTPSAKGDSRNIRLQVTLKRQSDGRTLNTSALINYVPEDLTQAKVQAVAAQREKVKEGGEWGDLFRTFMTLTRLATLQKIAGVRQLQKNGNGGLDLHPIFGKTAYFKLKDDDRNPQYKAVDRFQETKPVKAQIL